MLGAQLSALLDSVLGDEGDEGDEGDVLKQKY